MQKEKFLIIPNSKDLKLLSDFNSFILPLKDYSIGYNVYYELDEINKLASDHNIYVIMNKLLHKKISNLKYSRGLHSSLQSPRPYLC